MRTTRAQQNGATAVRRAVTSLAARARSERRGELSLTQVSVLGQVSVHGPITPGEVASRLRTMPQSLTRTFAALETAGLVLRAPDPADGRQSLLSITEPGQEALAAEMAPRDAWIAAAMTAMLTAGEQAELIRAADLMQRLIDFDAGPAPREQ